MGDIKQDQITERSAINGLASQISALGYTTMQCLQGISCEQGLSCEEDEAKLLHECAEKLGVSFQDYCRGICGQMAAESEHVDGGLQSVIFQLGAVSDYAKGHLNKFQIMWQRDLEGQRVFVSHAAIAIQDACDSIAAQIGREGKGDE